MVRVRRAEVVGEAGRRNAEQLARLGGEVRASRGRRRWTQVDLAMMAGVGEMTVSRIERGLGGTTMLDSWQRIGVALGRPFTCDLRADPEREPADAGHLAIQELMLKLGRGTGYDRTFEGAIKPADPARSIDVRLRSDRTRRLIVEELWNSIGDIGASARSFDRKVAETEAFAIALGDGRPYRVHGCWIVRATNRNRALLATYPEVFATKFPGSSEAWVRALTKGTDPPNEPGLVWCDIGATRLFAHRRRPARSDT